MFFLFINKADIIMILNDKDGIHQQLCMIIDCMLSVLWYLLHTFTR